MAIRQYHVKPGRPCFTGIASDQKKTEWHTGSDFLWGGSFTVSSGEPGDLELKKCVNSIKVTETSVVDHAVEVSSRWMKVKRIMSVVVLAQQKFLRNDST